MEASDNYSPKDDTSNNNKSPPSLTVFKTGFFLVIGSHGVITAFLPLYMKQLGLNPGQIGNVMVFRPLGGFFGGLLTPQLSKKLFSERTVAMAYACAFILCTFSISCFRPTDYAMNCPIEDNETLAVELGEQTVPQRGNGDIIQRAWMYQEDMLWLRMSCYALLLFLSDFFLVGLDTMIHGDMFHSLGKENFKSYGNVRAWGSMGYGAAAMSTGLAIGSTMYSERICSHLFISGDYHYLFYVFLWFSFLNLINFSQLFQEPVGGTKDSTKAFLTNGEIRQALCTVKTILWLVVLFCHSVFFAVTQGFLNWHLENIGASPILIGCANCITTTTEFFVFFATKRLIETFGHTKLILVGILSYVFRFVFYSVMTNPAFVLPINVIDGVMFACIWSTIVSHLSKQVPDEGQTQIQGLIQSLYMMGVGVGFPLSGYLTQIFGAPTMFLIFAVLATSVFFAFLAGHYRSVRY